jgi:glutamyl-tRNA synthetase
MRSDGTPTYHLCNVVDDYEQKVTTVIRGEDHISNTPRQIHIQQALGYAPLEYAHLPLVLGEDKKRLSKRHAATSLDEYQAEGYLDVAIINTLARLGWSGGKNEVFNLEELIRDFDFKDVQKAGAIFDLTKLDWINSQHLSQLDQTSFKKILLPHIDNLNIDYSDYNQLDELIESMRSVKPNLKLIAQSLVPYIGSFKEYDEKGVKKFLTGSERTLNLVLEMLDNLEVWNEAEIDKHLAKLQEKLELPTPKINQPIRIALTGSTQSPSLGLTIKLMGKNKSIYLLKKAIDFLS